MDGSALSLILGTLSSEALDLLCLLGIGYVAWRLHKHEEGCATHRKEFREQLGSNSERIATIEGRLED